MIIYNVYHFDYVDLFAFLNDEFVTDAGFDIDKFHSEALRLYGSFNDNQLSILENFRFDMDWFDRLDPGISRTVFLFNIFLVKFLNKFTLKDVSKEYVSISNLLGKIGIGKEDLHIVLFGKPLHRLVEISGNTILIDEFRSGIDQFGGWIDREGIQYFLSIFSEKRTKLAQLKDEYVLNSHEISILDTLIDMFKFSYEHEKSIFIITD